VADDALNRLQGKYNSRGEPKLSAQVLLPTPTASAYGRNKSASVGARVRLSLETMAKNSQWPDMAPTPTANDAKNGEYYSSGRVKLTGFVRMLPTPVAGDCNGPSGYYGTGGPKLLTIARQLPTPTARDWKSTSPARSKGNSRPLSEVAHEPGGGQLNPPWVEWLMGWPIDGTK
jgi:hypothetical protein